MTNEQLEEMVKKLTEELAHLRAQYTLLTVHLDQLEGFSRENFEREFAAFWASEGEALSKGYQAEMEKGLKPGES